MAKTRIFGLFAALALAFPAAAQVPSPVTQVQGPPTDINRGNPVKTGCVYNSSPPTATNGRVVECQADVNGALKVVASGSGTTADQVQGNVAHDAADSGNPVKVGGKAAYTAPAAVAVGDRADAWVSLNGAQAVEIVDKNGNMFDANVLNADNVGTTGVTLPTSGYGMVFDGTAWDRQYGDTNGTVVLPGLSSTYWSYSNGATGILSNTTTAVTIKTAAGAGVRNYIDSCTINTTAFGAAVPLAIRDGAGGTVLFALNVPTAGFLQPVNIQFKMPLRGTANTLLEVVTTTANTSGTAWVNCQGHTGS